MTAPSASALFPDVTGAAASCCLPLQGGFGMPFDIVGRPKGNEPDTGGAGYHPIRRAILIYSRFRCARPQFYEHDNGSAPGVVIINQAMAKQFWPKGDPLKDRLEVGAGMGPVFAEPPRQIIGVVGDMHDGGLDQDPGPTMYIPLAQMPDKVTALNSRMAPLWWIVRSTRGPHALTPLTQALREATGRSARRALSHYGGDRQSYHLAAALQHVAADHLRCSLC